MKKVIIIALVFGIILNSVAVLGAGTITGEILNTDIKAYIDSKPIKSYNINGWTGILAEDLMDYGFDVVWNSENRTLEVNKSVVHQTGTSTYEFEGNNNPVGSHAGYVYSTDIKTYVNGNEVNAFNIGGYTIIYIDELAVFGDVIWNAQKREISYSYSTPWQFSFALPNADNARHEGNDGIATLSGKGIKKAGAFDLSGENLDHVSRITLEYNKRYGGMRFNVSMSANHLLNDSKLQTIYSDILTINYDGTRLKNNADVANAHTYIFINGIPVKIRDVMQEKGNNNVTYCFVLDFDMNKDDINEISFEIK